MDRAQHFAGPGLATADDCDDGEEVSRVRLRYPKHLMSGTIALAHSLNHLQQEQSQFRIPKSNMLNETNPFEYTIPKITKFFKQIYTKGNVQNDGKITPLINK